MTKACPTNKKIVPRPRQKTAVFSIQNTWKRFQHFIRLVGSCCALALIYLVVSVLRALDGAGEWWLPGGELPPASRGDCRPWSGPGSCSVAAVPRRFLLTRRCSQISRLISIVKRPNTTVWLHSRRFDQLRLKSWSPLNEDAHLLHRWPYYGSIQWPLWSLFSVSTD